MQALFNIFETLCESSSSAQTKTRLYEVDSIRASVTTACFGIALGVAIRTPRVADLISIVCAFFTSPLMFAFPAIMHWKILGGRGIFVPTGLLLLTVGLWVAEILRLMS